MARECNPKRRPSHASCHIKSINENYLRGNRMKHFVMLIHILIMLSAIYQLEASGNLTELAEVKKIIVICASYAVISVIVALGGKK
jgi:hypothetical protein